MKNGDKLRCDFKTLDKNNLVVQTSFAKEVTVPVENLLKMEFLPETHEILYDSSEGLSGWKSSNRKSWSAEEGDLVSVYSGSTGTTLPQKDAIEVEFEAQWERSFYSPCVSSPIRMDPVTETRVTSLPFQQPAQPSGQQENRGPGFQETLAPP